MLTVRALRRQFVSIQLLPVLVQREEGRTRRKEPVNFAKQDASEHPHGDQAVCATVTVTATVRKCMICVLCVFAVVWKKIWATCEISHLNQGHDFSVNKKVRFFFFKFRILGRKSDVGLILFHIWPFSVADSHPRHLAPLSHNLHKCKCSVHIVDMSFCMQHYTKIPRIFKSIWD